MPRKTTPSVSPPAPIDPSSLPGAVPLRLLNIAPDEGDRIVGFIAYGLNALVAENEEGKSRALSAVSAIALEARSPEELITIVRGEKVAAAGLGTAEVRIETRDVGGVTKARVSRQGSASVGPIHHIPIEVEMLITGGGHVSEDSNWRTRLKALTDLWPVAVTEARLVELAGVLPGPDGDIAAELTDRHSAQPFPDLLTAADALADGRTGILHKRKRTAKEDAAGYAADVERSRGEADAIFAWASRESGLAGAELRRILLDESEEAAALPARLRTLETALSRLGFRVEERARARKERDGIREGLGERPIVEGYQKLRDEAAAALEGADSGKASAREAHAAADARLQAIDPRVDAAQGAIAEKWQALVLAEDHLTEAFAGREWPAPDAMVRLDRVQHAASRLGESCFAATGLRDEHAKLLAELQETSAAYSVAEDARFDAREALKVAEKNLSDAQARLDAWDRTSAQLSAPLPPLFPEPADFQTWQEAMLASPGVAQVRQASHDDDAAVLAAADGHVALLRPRALAAASGEAFRKAEAERQRLQDLQVAAKDRAERLEADASRVWGRLGDVISTALLSPIIRVGKERTIEIRLDDGTWADVADEVLISKGRLRRAMLDFWLDIVEPGEANVLVADEVMLPVGKEGREGIGRRALAKKKRILFEQPALGDEARELHVIHYGHSQAGGAA